MKKKLIIIFCMLVIALIIVAFANRKALNLFKKETPSDLSYDHYTLLYVMNNKNQLVGINVGTNGEITDEISHKWNLLTSDYHNLPKDYKSPIYVSTQLVNYNVKDNVMTMTLSDDFLYSEGRSVLECLTYNFCNNEVEELVLMINEEKLTSFENMTFDKISKNIGCNLTFESDNVFNTDDLTIIYHYDDYILPVTYYYDCSNSDFDAVEYLVKKAVSIDEYVSTIDYENFFEYEITDNKIAFTTINDIVLSTQTITTISDSIKINYDFTEILLNGVNI